MGVLFCIVTIVTSSSARTEKKSARKMYKNPRPKLRGQHLLLQKKKDQSGKNSGCLKPTTFKKKENTSGKTLLVVPSPLAANRRSSPVARVVRRFARAPRANKLY